MRSSKAVAGMVLTGVLLAVAGTGRLAVPADGPPSGGGLGTGLMAGMQPVEMHNPETGMTAAWRDRLDRSSRVDIPGAGYDGVRRSGVGAPPTSFELSNIAPGRRPAERRGILDGLDEPTAASGRSWGWLADDVNALSPTEIPPESGLGFLQVTEPRATPLDDRRSTGSTFGRGENSFYLQRRQDDRFQPSGF